MSDFREKHEIHEGPGGRREEHHEVRSGPDDRGLMDKAKDKVKDAFETTKEKAHDLKESAKDKLGSDKNKSETRHEYREEADLHPAEFRRV